MSDRVDLPIRNEVTQRMLAEADERSCRERVDVALERLLLYSMDERPHVIRRHGLR